METSNKDKKYLLGTDEKQQWTKKYFFNPRGIGFLEPGGDASDSAAMSAFNIVKSSYQIHPDVFNMDYLTKTLSISKSEIMKRMSRMYDERLIMYAKNSSTQVNGWGLYYWIVKLREGTSAEAKEKLANWFQNKDDICTGYQTKGDFDFINGNHMRVLDNLLTSIIEPWKHNPEVEYVHLCPVRRDIRESHVNMWDAPDDDYREFIIGDGQLEKLVKVQNKMDLTDLRIVAALNKKRPMEEVYDFNVLADISGLDPKDMLSSIKKIIETKRTFVPLFHINFANLGLTNHMFVIRTFQNIPCVRKAEIADELSKIKEFNTVIEFTDSFYDISVWAYNEVSDINALRNKLYSYSEIEKVLEADSDRQFRRWTCRLDDKDDYWEECVFTDDFLEDRTVKKNDCACRFSGIKEEK